jgi:hypothetical protein
MQPEFIVYTSILNICCALVSHMKHIGCYSLLLNVKSMLIVFDMETLHDLLIQIFLLKISHGHVSERGTSLFKVLWTLGGDIGLHFVYVGPVACGPFNVHC